MKKMLALGLLSLSLAQAKMFVGVDGGYVMAGSAVSGKADSSVYDGHYQDAWNVSANFGYETFFSSHFGARAFVSAGYGSIFDSAVSNHIFNVDGNIDLIVNIVSSFGVFAGIGAGYQYHSVASTFDSNNIPLFGRVGLTFGITDNLRLDLTAKLPIIAWDMDGSDIAGILPTVNSPLTVQAGIKFLF